jgi:hypothetical protein
VTEIRRFIEASAAVERVIFVAFDATTETLYRRELQLE